MTRIPNTRGYESPEQHLTKAQADMAELLYKMAHPLCAVCGKPATDYHHIPKGTHRQAAKGNTDCGIHTCNECNCGKMEDYSEWPIARQIAVKVQTIIESINRARGRPGAITPSDVFKYLEE